MPQDSRGGCLQRLLLKIERVCLKDEAHKLAKVLGNICSATFLRFPRARQMYYRRGSDICTVPFDVISYSAAISVFEHSVLRTVISKPRAGFGSFCLNDE